MDALHQHVKHLAFPGVVERDFHADYYEKSLVSARVALAMSIVLVGGFGILDYWALPDTFVSAWLLRYFILCPIIVAVLAASFFPIFKTYMQPLLCLPMIATGLGIGVMMGLAEPHEPGYASYYVGMILVSLAAYSFIRLRFRYSTAGGILIVLIYEIVAIFFQDSLRSSDARMVFISNNFFS